MQSEHRIPLAISCMILASLFTALGSALVKYASATISIEMLVFARNSVSFLLLLPWIMYRRPVLKTKEWKSHLIRGVAGLSTIFLFFFSLKELFLTDATLLNNTMPIFVPLVAFVWKKIPIPHRIYWGIGIAFLGILLILRPEGDVFQYTTFLALLSGMTGAVATLALRFAHHTEPMERTLFYYFSLGIIVAGSLSLTDVSGNWGTLDAQKLMLFGGIGVLGMAYQVLFTLAARHAPVRMTSSFMYSSVIFGMILDWWIWGQEIHPLAIVGFLLVAFGATLIVYLFPKK